MSFKSYITIIFYPYYIFIFKLIFSYIKDIYIHYGSKSKRYNPTLTLTLAYGCDYSGKFMVRHWWYYLCRFAQSMFAFVQDILRYHPCSLGTPVSTFMPMVIYVYWCFHMYYLHLHLHARFVQLIVLVQLLHFCLALLFFVFIQPYCFPMPQ